MIETLNIIYSGTFDNNNYYYGSSEYAKLQITKTQVNAHGQKAQRCGVRTAPPLGIKLTSCAPCSRWPRGRPRVRVVPLP